MGDLSQICLSIHLPFFGRFGRTKSEIRVEKGDFRDDFGGFGPCLGISHPPTHICERSPKKKVFLLLSYGTARFWNEDLKKTNMKKIMMPTKTIHISGIQAGKSPNDVKRAFQGAGLQVLLWHSLQYLSFTKSAMIDQSVCDQSDCPHRLWSALVLQ